MYKTTLNKEFFFLSPGTRSHWCFQGVGVTDHLIEDSDYLVKFGTLCAVFLPAVQHQLMQPWWTVHGGGKTVTLLNSLYDLRNE